MHSIISGTEATIQMRRRPNIVDLPMRTFKFSITYLGVLFAALLIDHYFLFQLSI